MAERKRESGSGGAERRSYQRSRIHVARARGVHGESSGLRLLQWLARLRANRTIGRFLLLSPRPSVFERVYNIESPSRFFLILSIDPR